VLLLLLLLLLLQVVCMTLFKASKLQLWWQESRSRTLLAAFLFADSTGATQGLYLANVHLEGSPYKPQERLAQVSGSLLAPSACVVQCRLSSHKRCAVPLLECCCRSVPTHV
jgi:hypothetical protein